MIKLENYEVVGWEHAIRGMRNPWNSWEKSDSEFDCGTCFCKDCALKEHDICGQKALYVGHEDMKLMKKLISAGTDHRKFMRMITVYVDITAPLYWWKEFDTYKVGTVANSCSTMHTIADKEFTLEDFSREHLEHDAIANLILTIGQLNINRKYYVATNEKKYWWQMIQLLPSSYNQKRTVMLNYEVLANIYKSRRNHKLDEWNDLCTWIENLPYSEIITRL